MIDNSTKQASFFAIIAAGSLLGLCGHVRLAQCHPFGGAAIAASSAKDVSGEYRHIGGKAELDRLSEAIDEATEEMSPGVQAIAREKLEESLRPSKSLEIRVKGDRVVIRSERQPAIEVPFSTTTKWSNADGEEFKLRVEKHGSSLVETLENDNTSTRITYRPSSSGRVRMMSTIRDDRLPGPIKYTLTYGHE